jgi:hypothetical protein
MNEVEVDQFCEAVEKMHGGAATLVRSAAVRESIRRQAGLGRRGARP